LRLEGDPEGIWMQGSSLKTNNTEDVELDIKRCVEEEDMGFEIIY